MSTNDIRLEAPCVHVAIEHFNEQGTMRYQLSGPIGIVTIDRPGHRNALSRQMWQTLENWIKQLPAKIKVLILRGAGRHFTAGSDIKEFSVLSVSDANHAFNIMESAIHSIECLPIPTIASINGPAYGAGFILSLACDIRVGSENAHFGMPVGKLGITLQPQFIRRMIQMLGPSRTKDMVYTARTYDATQALNLGILNYSAPTADLDAYTFALARSILAQSQASMTAVKASVQQVLYGLGSESDNWVDQYDFPKGVQAFKEKRTARF